MMNSRAHGFSHRLWRWLQKLGFTDDPFALYEADQEGELLLNFFVDRPYLHDIIGDPAHPQTAFLLARRGEGKTATREMVAYECDYGQLRRRALPVRYDDFSLLLEETQGDIAKITPRHHITHVIREIMKTLSDVPATYFDRLDEDIDRQLLMAYTVTFADPLSQLKLRGIIEDEPLDLTWDALSPLEMLTALSKLVVQLGQSPDRTYDSIYVLVDRVDETTLGSEATALLKPLVRQIPLLETSKVAFKFFLPFRIGEELRQKVDLRPDRLCVRNISWNRIALEDVIHQRLLYYSEGKVEKLEDLCTSAAKSHVVDRLIKGSEGSPRTLLRLCRTLIHQHVMRTDDALIDSVDIRNATTEFSRRLENERVSPGLAPSPSTVPPQEPPQQGLYVDASGHVWVDGQQLIPPLSQQEFALLKILYNNAPEIVPHEELLEAIWPRAAWSENEAYTTDNLRKLVSRLRERLETTVRSGQAGFVKTARGRGYWLKTQ